MKLHIDKEDYYISSLLDKYNNSYLYGETEGMSFTSILKKYPIKNKHFIDIGSGCGRLIFTLNNEMPSEGIIYTGIEIDKDRYLKSVNILENINFCESNIYLENTDFRNMFFGNFDILFCANLVFEVEDNNELYKKILSEFQGICFLFTYNDSIKNYLITSHIISTSWGNEVPIFVFIF